MTLSVFFLKSVIKINVKNMQVQIKTALTINKESGT